MFRTAPSTDYNTYIILRAFKRILRRHNRNRFRLFTLPSYLFPSYKLLRYVSVASLNTFICKGIGEGGAKKTANPIKSLRICMYDSLCE